MSDARTFAEAFENAAVGMAHVDLAGRWLSVNRRLCEITGLAREELLGSDLQSMIHPDDRANDAELFGELRAGHRASYSVEKRCHRRGVGEVWLNLTMSALRGEGGVVDGLMVVVEDVTSRKSAEHELRRAIALRDEFLSIASHELRTPLTTLGLQLDGIESIFEHEAASVDRDKVLRKVKSAMRQADRLTALVSELLNVSRMVAGRFPLELEEFDVAELVREVTQRFEEVSRRGSGITVEASSAAVGVWDRVRLDNALTNVVSNAIKYGAAKPIQISVEPLVDRVNVAVRDGGIGIASEDLERIFGRFERATSSAHYGGLGLGLFVAREIVVAHEGTIEADSKLGAGTTFTIRLPRRTAARGET